MCLYSQEHRGARTSRVNQLAVIDIIYSLMVSKNLDASIEAIEHTMEVTHRTLGRSSQQESAREERS
ncbi:MAG: hypothetical protein JXK93_13240 [Sphaerochaetaceae bacterium]|nr:hypothetical protein [Sphaerochaetaceae bacterium]